MSENNLIERLHAWSNISEHASNGWNLPAAGTEKIRNLCADSAAEIERLRNENADLRSDANRYRALHDSGKYAPSEIVGWGLRIGSEPVAPKLLDAAVDALIGSFQKGNPDEEQDRTPPRQCNTPGECRREGVCLDAWSCSFGSKQ